MHHTEDQWVVEWHHTPINRRFFLCPDQSCEHPAHYPNRRSDDPRSEAYFTRVHDLARAAGLYGSSRTADQTSTEPAHQSSTDSDIIVCTLAWVSAGVFSLAVLAFGLRRLRKS